MGCLVFALTFLWVSVSGSALGNDMGTLKFVHLVWRHGDRSPANGTFPTDIGNPDSSWPQGWGELTELGVKQHFALGRFFRERYGGFLSSQYIQSEVHVLSTGYNRTIMSALANLAGLFPPSGAQRWNASIPWQPIPVHSRPRELDPLLWMEYPCPAATELQKEVHNSKPYLKFLHENADFFEFLRQKAGLEKEMRLGSVFDPLLCEKMHPEEHPWPSWVNVSVYERIANLYNTECTFGYSTIAIQRLRGGMLLGEILARMERVESSQQNHPSKLFVYSAHDTTVMALLANLGVPITRNPPYTATIILELRQQNNGDYFVELLFKNDTGAPHRLEMGECGVPCRLEDLARRSRPRIPLDYRKECGLPPDQLFTQKQLMMIIAFLTGLCLAFLVAFVSVSLRLTRIPKNGIIYQKLPTGLPLSVIDDIEDEDDELKPADTTSIAT